MASDGQTWQEGKSLAECNKYMLTNSVSTDVTFIVGENRTQVLAHKYVLGSRSSVFYAMLFGPMAESNATINIQDIELDIFQEILRYLYYEEATVTNENVTSLMAAADKYNIIGVTDRCAEYLTSGITLETVCNILDIALTLQKGDLKNKCLNFIFDNPEAVLQSSSFCDLQRESLLLILQSDELAASETLIYESVKKWAETQCRKNNTEVCDSNLREMIGDLKTLIRFTVMDKDDFTKIVSIDDILSSEEKVEIFQVYGGINPNDERMFCSTKPRTGLEFVCYRSLDLSGLWGINGLSDIIDFMVSDKVKVMGYVLCASMKPNTYEVDAKLRVNETTLASVSTTYLTTKGEKTFRVMFKSGVIIEPNVRYTAEVTLRGPYSMCCKNASRTVEENGIKFTFITYGYDKGNGTNIKMGQIPGIVYRKIMHT